MRNMTGRGDAPLQLPWSEVVVYSTHVRGFTKHASSGVKAKGTFAGVAEKIPYLKELGINQLELMPVYEFAEVEAWDEKRPPLRLSANGQKELVNYWGYSESYYFAPKASYSATGDPVREFKDLVRELHKNGIELVLEFHFPKGTRTALALDCVRHWVLEYHIDGIHVNRDHAPVEALAQDPLLSHTKIMSEGFQLEEIYEERHIPNFRNLAEYNDGFMLDVRRFLKGDEGQLAPFAWRARRNPSEYAVINYMANITALRCWTRSPMTRSTTRPTGRKTMTAPIIITAGTAARRDRAVRRRPSPCGPDSFATPLSCCC